MGDNKSSKGHFTIDTSMRPYLPETHYVAISDGETNYCVAVPAKLKKKYFKLYRKIGVQSYTEQMHCVAIVLCIEVLPPEKIISIRICTDISKRAMHNYLLQFIRHLYHKISAEKAPSKSNAHHYVTKVRKGRAPVSLFLTEMHLKRFIRIKKS